MISISCSNVTKYYGIDLILDKISFSLNERERVGLIGDNGSGKTTLFKIITGEIPYDSGNVFLSKDKKVGYLKQKNNYSESQTIYEACLPTFQNLIDMENKLRLLEKEITIDSNNKKLLNEYSDYLDLFEKKGGYTYQSKIRGILNGLGFKESDYNTFVNILSGGQKSRLQLALLLLDEPDILLLDEPTNHLDLETTTWLENYLLDYPNTVITITHDRYFLDKISTKIFEIENNKLIEHKGTYSEFQIYKKNISEIQSHAYAKQQNKIKKQEEIIRRFKGRGTEKLVKRAQSREKMLDKIEVLEKPSNYNPIMKMRFEPNITSGEEVLKVNNLSKTFDKLLFENLNFDIFKGEKIGLIGPNGIGKTTLFKIILNEVNPSDGEISLGHNVFTGYFDQEQQNLNLNNTVFDEILEIIPKATNTEIRTKLGMFLFQEDDVFKTINSLSGGEKGRLSLLKLILTNSNFILLDEPTNHLDIKSKEVLEKALINYTGTLLIISHDRYFLNQVTNKIFEFSKNNIKTYLGNYDYYIEKKKVNKELFKKDIIPNKTKTELKKELQLQKEKQKLIKKKKQRSEEIFQEIETFEKKLQSNEELLCKKEIYTDGNEVKKINMKNNNLEKTINELYEELSDLEIFLENL
ncbi:MAG: ABC-F family ATP-binding cassette domain-containing protein [Bacillota bacterium]|nr:ABC-F family ATP-binding cassette domain-containing protein [Bacillota bacterium]